MILIAEDQVVFQELYSLVLNKLGLPFILAVDGRQAIDKALQNDPALILMDIQMPLIDGYGAAEELRKLGFKKPIIAVTADDKKDEESCQKAGIDDLLLKPFKPSDVERIIDRWMDAERKPPVVSEEETSSKQKEVFDSAAMFDTFMNNEEIAISLLSRFIERTQGQLEKLSSLKKITDWDKCRQIAHMIRGAAFTMGGSELGKIASRLELAYKNTDTEEIEAAFPFLEKAFERFKKDAEDFINSRS